jgi:hypothetical protein
MMVLHWSFQSTWAPGVKFNTLCYLKALLVLEYAKPILLPLNSLSKIEKKKHGVQSHIGLHLSVDFML